MCTNIALRLRMGSKSSRGSGNTWKNSRPSASSRRIVSSARRLPPSATRAWWKSMFAVPTSCQVPCSAAFCPATTASVSGASRSAPSRVSDRTVPHSRTRRRWKTSIRSASLGSRTNTPRCSSCMSRPSWDSSRKASRRVLREIFSRAPSISSDNRVPGGCSPAVICRRKVLAIRSAVPLGAVRGDDVLGALGVLGVIATVPPSGGPRLGCTSSTAPCSVVQRYLWSQQSPGSDKAIGGYQGHRCSGKDAMARRTYGTVGLLIVNVLTVAALSASDPSAGRTDAAAADQPRNGDCYRAGAALTVEEQRVDDPLPGQSQPAAAQFIDAGGFRSTLDRFERRLCTLARVEQAGDVIAAEGAELWQRAVARAQGNAEIGTIDAYDDRPLYWARTSMKRALREWQPQFELTSLQRQAMIRQFEYASRGIDMVQFTDTDGAAQSGESGDTGEASVSDRKSTR